MPASFVPKLLLITPPDNEEAAMMAVVAQALQGGVDAILLRKKDMNTGHLLALAAKLRLLTRQYNARLLIHTQADICLAVDADGVHLSSKDMTQATQLRQYLGDHNKCISVACHGPEALQQAARLGVDFALLSPVFATKSHPDCTPLGLERFLQLGKQSPLPIIALGGIDRNNRHTLSGYGVAVIRAIWHAKDPKQAAYLLTDVLSL